ncbi:hypothetical protein LTS15_009961 [Exophiala xenobiotica]|nr:hypothetical protein LTS15_009961 [Exophiala xenobiotica]
MPRIMGIPAKKTTSEANRSLSFRGKPQSSKDPTSTRKATTGTSRLVLRIKIITDALQFPTLVAVPMTPAQPVTVRTTPSTHVLLQAPSP